VRVYLKALWHPERLREALLSDGWGLEEKAAGAFLAEHPEAQDEPAVRRRLWRLGLLTSRSLCIEFPV
jgi:hypothetical protein